MRRAAAAARLARDAGKTPDGATDEDNFPMREKFDQLKSSGALATPEATARQLIGYALSDAFGTEPTADVRNLPTQ